MTRLPGAPESKCHTPGVPVLPCRSAVRSGQSRVKGRSGVAASVTMGAPRSRFSASGRQPARHAAGVHGCTRPGLRSEEHTSELQSRENLVCRLLLEKKNIYEQFKVADQTL